MTETTDPGFPASEPLENQGLQEPKSDLSGKPRELAFEQINEVTVKLTDGRGSIAWSGDRSGGYRTNRAVAWLMGVGNGRWIVRDRNKASKPMKLPAAKRYAVEMVKGIRPGATITEPIKHLNTMAAAVVGANADWLPPVEPDLVDYIRYIETGWEGGARDEVPSKQAPTRVIDPRIGSNHDGSTPGALQGDDYPLTYDLHGNVELPACLDRRKPKIVEEAA